MIYTDFEDFKDTVRREARRVAYKALYWIFTIGFVWGAGTVGVIWFVWGDKLCGVGK